jgi:hypothetical protein
MIVKVTCSFSIVFFWQYSLNKLFVVVFLLLPVSAMIGNFKYALWNF